jgi:hypothetical protein
MTKGSDGRRLRDALEYTMHLDKLAKREIQEPAGLARY